MFKSAKSKVGVGVIIFGIISIIITQSADNGTSFGQSLLVASVFFIIGAVLIILGRKQEKPETSEYTPPAYTPPAPGSVMIYPGSQVYHTDGMCSYSYESPIFMLEEEAKAALESL